MTEMLSATAAKNFVGGDWSESASGETYEKHNPWRPSEVTGVYAASTAEDAQAAVDAALAAFPAGREPPRRRGRRSSSRLRMRSSVASSRSRRT